MLNAQHYYEELSIVLSNTKKPLTCAIRAVKDKVDYIKEPKCRISYRYCDKCKKDMKEWFFSEYEPEELINGDDLTQGQIIAEEEEQETKDKKSIRQEVLQAAIETVCHDREDQYGNPENNFEAIANFWNVYLNTKHGLAENNKLVKFIEADDVAAMMMLLKIARIATGAPKRDNWVDSAGYAGCGAEIQESKVSDNA